jgi:hypothetical protein
MLQLVEPNQHDSAFSHQAGNAPVLTFPLTFWAHENSTEAHEIPGVAFVPRGN